LDHQAADLSAASPLQKFWKRMPHIPTLSPVKIKQTAPDLKMANKGEANFLAL
jgi:hypothetical protein